MISRAPNFRRTEVPCQFAEVFAQGIDVACNRAEIACAELLPSFPAPIMQSSIDAFFTDIGSIGLSGLHLARSKLVGTDGRGVGEFLVGRCRQDMMNKCGLFGREVLRLFRRPSP